MNSHPATRPAYDPVRLANLVWRSHACAARSASPARARDWPRGPMRQREGNRGGGATMEVRCRSWLRRGWGYRCVRLDCAHQGVQLIGAIAVAREGGVGNGGPRPRTCRLRRVDDGSALGEHRQHMTDSDQWRQETVRGSSGMATCELGWRQKWWHGGAAITVSSTKGKNRCSVRLWMWRGSRRCYGQDELDNGAQIWVGSQWRSLLSPGCHSHAVEKDREREWRERGREWGAGTAFICEHTRATWRSWLGMHATRWLSPEPISHTIRLKSLNMTESKPGWPTDNDNLMPCYS
jgi:hypothetical protein